MPRNPESSEVTTRPARAQLTPELVQPPARVYMTLDDQLYIRSRSNLAGVTLRLAGRVLTPAGEIVPFNFEHTPQGSGATAVEAFRLAEGYLLSAVVFPRVGSPQRGQTFVEIGFLRGIGGANDIVDVLAKDYVALGEPIAFPGSPIVSSVDGPGAIRSITGTDPAAGVEISETVPVNTRWRVIVFHAVLVADATAVNRNPLWEFGDGTNTILAVQSKSNVPASATGRFSLGAVGAWETAEANRHLVPLPYDFLLPTGFTFATTTTNLQAGDDWAAPQLVVEEWVKD